jgi:hypothetical protein
MQHFCIEEVWCGTVARGHATGNLEDTPPPPPPPKLLKPPPLKPPLLPPRKPPRKPPPRKPPPLPPPLKRERCLASAPSRVTASAHSTASNNATSLNMLLLEVASGLNCDYGLHTIKNSFGTCLAETMPSTQSPCTVVRWITCKLPSDTYTLRISLHEHSQCAYDPHKIAYSRCLHREHRIGQGRRMGNDEQKQLAI